MLSLKASGTAAIVTFLTNCLKNCPLANGKELKSQGRGSYDYRTDAHSGLHVVKLYDNKCVHVASAFSGVGASASVKRWDLGKKEHFNVTLPDMSAYYISSMGGVDLADMLIALYSTETVSKKRWYLKKTFHMVDICKVNGWLLYCRHFNRQDVLKKSKMLLLELNASMVNSLRLAENISSSGRPKKRSLSGTSIVGRKPMPDMRYDSLDHFKKFNEKRNRCSFCPDAIAMYLVQNVKLCPAFEKRKIVFLIPSLNKLY